MAGLNDIFSIGKKALIANQLGMHITSENISNAQNPDYSRQSVNFARDQYLYSEGFAVGTGVKVDDIQRMRDQLVDVQVWQGKSELGRWENGQKYASSIEGIFTDLGSNGLADLMTEFWNSWMDLGNHPKDSGVRSTVRSKAQQLIDTFHNINGQLNSITDQAKDELQDSVHEANSIVQKIADLNKKILANSTTNGTNNVLLDQRDALINQLSDLLDITTVFHDDGTVSLFNSYQTIVDEGQAYSIELNWQSENDIVQASISLNGNENAQAKSGKIKSLIDTINVQTRQLSTQLDQLVTAFVQKVNQVHESNYSLNGEIGISFFAPTGLTSGSIQLAKQISDSLSNIAVSKNGQSGDGSGALDMANIKDEKILSNNQVTIEDYYGSILTQLGEASKSNQQNVDIQTDMVNMLENQRQSVMGVSLEEEMVNMIKFQQAFGAASKIITTVDEMMQTLIEMVG